MFGFWNKFIIVGSLYCAGVYFGVMQLRLEPVITFGNVCEILMFIGTMIGFIYVGRYVQRQHGAAIKTSQCAIDALLKEVRDLRIEYAETKIKADTLLHEREERRHR